MTTHDQDSDAPAADITPRDAIHDRRPRPRGVLPRHLQTWILMGLAAAMLLIILISGNPGPLRTTPGSSGQQQPSAALSPDRLRKYQEQLTQQEARLRQELAESQAAAAATAAAPQLAAREQKPSDPLADEQRRRTYSSLFAENVAFTRRSAGAPVRLNAERAPFADRPDASEAPLSLPRTYPTPPIPPVAPVASPATPAGNAPTGAASTIATASATPSEGTRRIVEGTVIEAVLTNRLDGSLSGPVNALVTTPVYTDDRQTVLIPEGARVLGTAAPVQAFGESRLAVRFHRLVMPNGQTYSLEQFAGLNQRGDAGLKDQVDRHYLQLFGASVAIGALSGLAQYATRSGASGPYAFPDAYGQGVGASLAASAARILDRFLNVLPTITIHEGHRLKIYLTSDLQLPPYVP